MHTTVGRIPGEEPFVKAAVSVMSNFLRGLLTSRSFQLSHSSAEVDPKSTLL